MEPEQQPPSLKAIMVAEVLQQLDNSDVNWLLTTHRDLLASKSLVSTQHTVFMVQFIPRKYTCPFCCVFTFEVFFRDRDHAAQSFANETYWKDLEVHYIQITGNCDNHQLKNLRLHVDKYCTTENERYNWWLGNIEKKLSYDMDNGWRVQSIELSLARLVDCLK